MCTHTPPRSQAGQGSCRGLTNVAPRPAPRLGEAVERVQTQSEKPCEGLRPQVASCLVSFMLVSAPPETVGAAPGSLEATGWCWALCRVGPPFLPWAHFLSVGGGLEAAPMAGHLRGRLVGF